MSILAMLRLVVTGVQLYKDRGLQAGSGDGQNTAAEVFKGADVAAPLHKAQNASHSYIETFLTLHDVRQFRVCNAVAYTRKPCRSL